jgi:alpha-beta hydrolase superfamily lysophospholipase
MGEGAFAGVGGVEIFTRSWHPPGKARAAVVVVHGFNSHSGQYVWVAEQLVKSGLAVHALDLRGRGKSGGERFYVERIEDYVDDVATFVGLVKAREPGLPVFMLGHSAGGVISCVYALDHQEQLAGLVCESFAYKVWAPDLVLTALKGLSHVVPHAHVFRLKNEDFSRDPKVVAALNADPLIAHEVQPAQTAAAMLRADERLKKEFSRIELPLLVLHGTEDKATQPSGSKELYAAAGSSDKTLKLYEGHFHDLLADVDRQVVLDDVRAWLDARLGTG